AAVRVRYRPPAQRPYRLRGTRPAFLSRGAPGAPRDRRDVPRVVPARARHSCRRRTGATAVVLHPRHQAPRVRVHTPLTAGPGVRRRVGWERSRPSRSTSVECNLNHPTRAAIERGRRAMDYKHTLNLPKTDFPMRANLPAREPATVARWKETNLYRQVLAG